MELSLRKQSKTSGTLYLDTDRHTIIRVKEGEPTWALNSKLAGAVRDLVTMGDYSGFAVAGLLLSTVASTAVGTIAGWNVTTDHAGNPLFFQWAIPSFILMSLITVAIVFIGKSYDKQYENSLERTHVNYHLNETLHKVEEGNFRQFVLEALTSNLHTSQNILVENIVETWVKFDELPDSVKADMRYPLQEIVGDLPTSQDNIRLVSKMIEKLKEQATDIINNVKAAALKSETEAKESELKVEASREKNKRQQILESFNKASKIAEEEKVLRN